MTSILFTIELGKEALYSRGSVCRAQFYDAQRGQFYAGSSDVSAWDAVAWAIAEREARTASAERPMIARHPSDTPASWLARVLASPTWSTIDDQEREREKRKRDMSEHNAAPELAPETENGTIQRAGGLALPVVEPKKPAAARRARARKSNAR